MKHKGNKGEKIREQAITNLTKSLDSISTTFALRRFSVHF